MCKCNHKSRQDEQKCCCECHGKSNMKKSCYSEKRSSVNEEPKDTETFEKR
jgi:hypothetical protein